VVVVVVVVVVVAVVVVALEHFDPYLLTILRFAFVASLLPPVGWPKLPTRALLLYAACSGLGQYLLSTVAMYLGLSHDIATRHLAALWRASADVRVHDGDAFRSPESSAPLTGFTSATSPSIPMTVAHSGAG
jgi:hypothetical protein